MKKYDNFCKALENLKKIRDYSEPYDTVTQTGMIALFEICFEQSWKMMKAVLEEQGRSPQRIGSPKMIIKLAYESGLIDDEALWLELLETRNVLTHTYDEAFAAESIRTIKEKYIALFEKLSQTTKIIAVCDSHDAAERKLNIAAAQPLVRRKRK